MQTDIIEATASVSKFGLTESAASRIATSFSTSSYTGRRTVVIGSTSSFSGMTDDSPCVTTAGTESCMDTEALCSNQNSQITKYQSRTFGRNAF